MSVKMTRRREKAKAMMIQTAMGVRNPQLPQTQHHRRLSAALFDSHLMRVNACNEPMKQPSLSSSNNLDVKCTAQITFARRMLQSAKQLTLRTINYSYVTLRYPNCAKTLILN